VASITTHVPSACEPTLIAAQTIQNESKRAEVLSNLAAHFPAAYEPALVAAQTIQDESKRAEVLSKLIPRFSNLSILDQFAIWQNLLRVSAQRKRPELLCDLKVSVPLIATLGGEAAGVAIVDAVQQVAKWWK
jgi:hypothetical protein